MNNKVSSFFRLDEQVFFTMGGVCLLSLIILAFRFSTDRACSPVSIQVSSDAMMEGLAIRFKAQTEAGKSYNWNFGDGQVSEDQTATTTHTFKKAGKYTVSVMVNGQCSDLQNVVIREKPSIANSPMMPMISATPDNIAYINESVRFTEITPNSNSWEWNFGETTIVDATTRSAEYFFKTAGTKTVSVKINGNPELIKQKFIQVIEREDPKNNKVKEPKKNSNRPVVIAEDPIVPPIGTKPETPVAETQPKPEPVKAPQASNQLISTMLKGVVSGSVTAGDFSAYLCGNLSITVFFNGDKMTFTEMCEKLKGYKRRQKKKLEDLPVVLTRDQQTGCIVGLVVSEDKKSTLFGL